MPKYNLRSTPNKEQWRDKDGDEGEITDDEDVFENEKLTNPEDEHENESQVGEEEEKLSPPKDVQGDQLDTDPVLETFQNQSTKTKKTLNKTKKEIKIKNQLPDVVDSPVTSRSSSSAILLVSFLILVVSVAGFCYKDELLEVYDIVNETISPVTGKDQDKDQPWMRFKEMFKNEFVPKYLNAVPKSSIKVIKAAVRPIMKAAEDEIISPSVILILGKEGNKNVSCFANDLIKMIARSFNEDRPDKIFGGKINSQELENRFQEILGSQKKHLIVIDQFNHLDAESAARLHRFTDHESAVFNSVIIILIGYTDNVNKLQSDSSLREVDSVASNLLEQNWIDSLPQDTISPLISRLTPSVTAVLDSQGQITIC